MARGKSKSDEKSTQLALFPEEQPAENSLAEEPAEVPAPSKKRGRKKKSPDLAVPEDSSLAEDAEEPLPPPPPEEKPPLPPPTEEEKEAERKEKYRKVQEERLAALKRVRSKK